MKKPKLAALVLTAKSSDNYDETHRVGDTDAYLMPHQVTNCYPVWSMLPLQSLHATRTSTALLDLILLRFRRDELDYLPALLTSTATRSVMNVSWKNFILKYQLWLSVFWCWIQIPLMTRTGEQPAYIATQPISHALKLRLLVEVLFSLSCHYR